MSKDYVCEDGFALGKWLHNAKFKRTRGTLPQDVTERLEALGMVWNAREQSWFDHCQECKDYLRLHPGEGIPVGLRASAGTDLHIWFMKNHRAYQAGTLSSDKAERFAEIDYDPKSERQSSSNVNKCLHEEWVSRCMELKAFYEENGHLRIPEELSDLRKWFWTQRSIFRKGGYSAARIQFLDDNGLRELFQAPIRKGTVKVSVWLEQTDYAALMKKAQDAGCGSLEEYLVKLAKT